MRIEIFNTGDYKLPYCTKVSLALRQVFLKTFYCSYMRVVSHFLNDKLYSTWSVKLTFFDMHID